MSVNKDALEAEAQALTPEENSENGKTKTTVREFEHKGQTYTVETNIEEWDLEVMLAYEEGKSISLARGLLGPAQWTKYMATKPKNKDFAEFADVLLKNTMGVTEGE